MLNTNGALAVLDRGITINWEDGPTLHRMTAQVRYHTATLATTQLLRIHAYQREDVEPLTYEQDDDVLHAVWTWRDAMRGTPGAEGDAAESGVNTGSGANTGWASTDSGATTDSRATTDSGATTGSPYWTVQLSVTNTSEESIYLDVLDVIRIDSAYAGQFNLGAPPGLWRCARENMQPIHPRIAWEAWSEALTSAGGFMRQAELLVQPTVSNRSRPPAVLIRTLEPGSDGSQANEAQWPAEISLELNGERFERLVARNRAEGALLGPALTLTSSAFLVASGDNAEELRHLPQRTTDQ